MSSTRSTPHTAPAGTTSPAPIRRERPRSRGARAGGDPRPSRSACGRGVGAGRPARLLPVARGGAARRGGRLRPAARPGHDALGPRAARRRRERARPCRRARHAGCVPARSGDPVGAHPAPARRGRSGRRDRRALRRARGLAADGRRAGEPSVRDRRAEGAAAGLAALRRLGPREVDGYQPYWAALAHLARAAGERDWPSARASAPWVSAPIRRCGAFFCATPSRAAAVHTGGRSAPRRLPCASSSA